jgi:SAM-dependent methyltransferase
MNDPFGDFNPVARFSARATDYVKHRPTYPAEVIETILDGLGAPADLTAADVGAGTGISARLLADRGVQVIAVEPSEAMRQAAAPHPHVSWLDGTAEATGLPSQSVDLVVCAQSFHWFRAAEALLEFARILEPRGRLALVWNRRSKTDPFTVGYRQAIVSAGGESPFERMEFDPGVVGASGLFAEAGRTSAPNVQWLDVEGLIGRARSTSYVPADGPDGDRLIEDLRALHAKHADADGRVPLRYETEVYRARKL